MTYQKNQRYSIIPVVLVMGLVLEAAGQAEAQYYGVAGSIGPFAGFDGYGANPGGNYLGGWGYYPGVRSYRWGYGSYGLQQYRNWWPQFEFFRMQGLARNASRYNLNSAEATAAYEAGNIYRQEAMDELYRTRMQQYQPRKYRTPPRESPAVQGRAPTSQSQRPAPTVEPTASFDQMIARDGEVFWPLGAPDEGYLGSKRDVASDAIKTVIQQAQNGPVSVRRVVHARNALADYAVPAALALKKDRPDDVDGFASYIQTLDAGLRSLATDGGGIATATQPGAPSRSTRTPDIEPPNAPESAGNVLKKKIENQPEGRR